MLRIAASAALVPFQTQCVQVSATYVQGSAGRLSLCRWPPTSLCDVMPDRNVCIVLTLPAVLSPALIQRMYLWRIATCSFIQQYNITDV